ncbi:hypothetical protein BX659_10287 [Orenia metallireducens]|uniref:Uncharacterized protein n=1 Tax=Orenia metallireducens TaxID=1413210 RepID=A0A285F5A8_9FIRM|nr:hypothetical protein [Orenia metallireducens]PRX34772.1 hypothetical protein BX659_10287 [Orenia metallireducens]SNY05566.1 hypothetical protein SAMN06265827_10187 [Orenia metallireducens]
MVELKKVDALSAAKVYVLTIMPFLLLGFLLNLTVVLAGGDVTELFLGLVQIVFAFIGTFIGAKIYNFLAARVGGLKAEVVSLESKLSEGRKERMIEVKSFDIKSIVKIYGAIAAAISLIFAIFALIFGILAGEMSLVSLAIVSPIIYIVLGIIFSALMGWIYNFVAAKLGGVKVELEGKIEEDSIV